MFPDEEDDDADYIYEEIDDFVTTEELDMLNKWYRGDIKRKELEFSNAWLPPTHR